jgi:hypothetical protein
MQPFLSLFLSYLVPPTGRSRLLFGFVQDVFQADQFGFGRGEDLPANDLALARTVGRRSEFAVSGFELMEGTQEHRSSTRHGPEARRLRRES